MTSMARYRLRARRGLLVPLLVAFAVGPVSPVHASTKFLGTLVAHAVYSQPIPLTGGSSVSHTFDSATLYMQGSFERDTGAHHTWSLETFNGVAGGGSSTAPESLAGGQATGSFSKTKTDTSVSCSYGYQRTGTAGTGAMQCTVTDTGESRAVSGACSVSFVPEPLQANPQQIASTWMIASCDLGLSNAPNAQANPTGNATADHVAISGTGCARTTQEGVALSGIGCASSEGGLAASGTGDTSGALAASGGGDASGWGAAASGTGCASTSGVGVAASVTGCADSSGAALSGTGNASGSAAASGIGCASGGFAVASSCADGTWGEVKGIGNADADVAVTGDGCATSPGSADGSVADPVTGYAVSGTGCANGHVAGVSGTGDASGGLLGVSGTGDADGGVADLSGNDLVLIAGDTADSVTADIVEAQFDVCEATDGNVCPETAASSDDPPSRDSCTIGAGWKLSKKPRGKAWVMNPWTECPIRMSYLGAYMELLWNGNWVRSVGESYGGGGEHNNVAAYSAAINYFCGTSNDGDPSSCKGHWRANFRWRLILPSGYYWKKWSQYCSRVYTRELVCQGFKSRTV